MSYGVLFEKYLLVLALIAIHTHVLRPEARSASITAFITRMSGSTSSLFAWATSFLNTARVAFFSKTLSTAHAFRISVYPANMRELDNELFAIYEDTPSLFLATCTSLY